MVHGHTDAPLVCCSHYTRPYHSSHRTRSGHPCPQRKFRADTFTKEQAVCGGMHRPTRCMRDFIPPTLACCGFFFFPLPAARVRGGMAFADPHPQSTRATLCGLTPSARVLSSSEVLVGGEGRFGSSVLPSQGSWDHVRRCALSHRRPCAVCRAHTLNHGETWRAANASPSWCAGYCAGRRGGCPTP